MPDAHPMSCHCPECTCYIPPEDIGKELAFMGMDLSSGPEVSVTITGIFEVSPDGGTVFRANGAEANR